MAQLSKQALKVGNNTSFPNNNTNYITPAILRDFNVDMIDSMVDEIPYGAYTQSVNTSLSNINAFTASASGLTTGSLLITASAAGNVITFTKGNNTTFNVTVATGSIPDISNLNQATASLQQYTASANIRFTNIETTTASLNTSVSNINTFTASTAISLTNLNQSSASQQISIDSLNSKTGSYATTGSNTFVGSNTFTSISASSFVSASAFIGNGGQLTGITASIAIPVASNGVPQGTATTLDFYGNAVGVQVIGGTALININAIGTGSFNAYTASTNAFTASAQVSINNLNLFTASFSTASLVSTSSFNSYTSSNNQRVSSLEVNSASVNTSISALNTYTASQSTASLVTSINNLNTFSASTLTRLTNIETTTASLNTSVSNINTFTASAQTSIDNLNAATSSYIKSSQTSSMSVATASVATAVSTSISTQNLQHFVTFVDNSTGTQAIYVDGGIKYNPNQDLLLVNNITSSGYISGSSLNLTGTLTASLANGYVWVGNGGNITSLVATSSFGSGGSINTGSFITTGSASTALQTVKGDFKFDTTYTASGSYASIVGGSNIVSVDYNSADALFDYWTSVNFAGVVVTGTGVVNGVITGYSYGSGIDVSITTGVIVNGASYTFTGPAIQTIDVTGSLSVGNNIIATGTNGHITINQNAISVQPADDSSNTSISPANLELQINTGDVIGMAASASVQGGLDGTWLGPNIFTAYSGSYRPMFGFQSQTTWTDGRITALKPLVVSGSLSVSGSSTFKANATVTGSLNVTGSNTLIGTKTITGSVFISGSKTIIGTNTVTGSMITTGSFILTGSAYGNVVSMSITSNTASMDLSKGNYFELTSSTTPCRINITNLQPGLTSTLIVSASASSSILFSTNVAEPSGSAYSGSAGSIDILSFIAFNSSKINVVATKALV